MRYGTKALPAIDWEREYETVAERRREAAKDFASGAPGAAAACGDLADRLRDAGRSGEAEPLYREALDLWRKLSQVRPAAWLPLLAESCGDLADLLSEAGQTAEAVELSREALGLWWELEASDSAWRPDLAESCEALADLLTDAGEVREAEELYREALGLWRKLARSGVQWEEDLADTCRSLADLLASSGGPYGMKSGGRTDGGLNSGGKAVGPNKRGINGQTTGVAAVKTSSGVDAKPAPLTVPGAAPSPARAKEAEVLYCEALDLYRNLSRRASRYGADAALVCNNLGTLLCGQGRRDAGEWFYRQAIDLHRRQPDRADSAPFAASACGNLAGSVEERNPAEAERLYRSALDAWRKLVRGPDTRYLREAADACFRLASFLFTVRGDRDGAESLMREALSYLLRDVRHMEAAAHIRRVLAEWGLADPIIELPASLPAEQPASLPTANLSAEQSAILPGELSEQIPEERGTEPPEELPEPSQETEPRANYAKKRRRYHARPSKELTRIYRHGNQSKRRSGGWRWTDVEKPRRWARPGKR